MYFSNVTIMVNGTEYKARFYDGVRLNKIETEAPNANLYHTRHEDNDWAIPVTISPFGIMVNFCGTIATDEPLPITEETDIDDINFID